MGWRLAKAGRLVLTGGGPGVMEAANLGTVQEIFQAATKTYYGTDGGSGPFVFLGREFWGGPAAAPVLLRDLLAGAPAGDLSGLVHLTDRVDEAVGLLTGA